MGDTDDDVRSQEGGFPEGLRIVAIRADNQRELGALRAGNTRLPTAGIGSLTRKPWIDLDVLVNYLAVAVDDDRPVQRSLLVGLL